MTSVLAVASMFVNRPMPIMAVATLSGGVACAGSMSSAAATSAPTAAIVAMVPRMGEQHVEAFAVPIKPGKEETWKSWIAETNGARKAEFDEMNERMGLTTHAAWLQQNPDGSRLAVVVVDGPGASEFLGKLATSGHAFDTWFRTNVEDIHPMDFSAPPPPAPVRFL